MKLLPEVLSTWLVGSFAPFIHEELSPWLILMLMPTKLYKHTNNPIGKAATNRKQKLYTELFFLKNKSINIYLKEDFGANPRGQTPWCRYVHLVIYSPGQKGGVN